MPRALIRPAAPARHIEPSPAPYWTKMTNVRAPGSLDHIGLVLVGPSGLHVVVDRPPHPDASSAVSEADTGLERVAQRAAGAAFGVADLLPPRDRHVVTSQVSLAGLTETAIPLGVALAASPDVLGHVWGHGPRVLSTSEAAVIATRLRTAWNRSPRSRQRRQKGGGAGGLADG